MADSGRGRFLLLKALPATRNNRIAQIIAASSNENPTRSYTPLIRHGWLTVPRHTDLIGSREGTPTLGYQTPSEYAASKTNWFDGCYVDY